MPTIERRTTPRGRTYRIGEAEYPSVTTILSAISKPALIGWAAREERDVCLTAAADLYEEIHGTPKLDPLVFRATLEARLGRTKAHRRASDKAREIGALVHQAIEHTTRTLIGQEGVGPLPALSDPAQWAYMAWEDWRRTHDVRPLHIEQIVWSHTHRYAGTTDLIALVDGHRTVIDYKTGKAIYVEAALQLAAYARAIEEMGHGPITQGIVVRLPKTVDDPLFETQQLTQDQLRALLPVFDAVHRVYDYLQQMEAPHASSHTPV